MDILEAIKSRKSIRGYKPDPVPPEVIKEILRLSLRAPSTRNAQPWKLTVVTGRALDSIRQGNLEMYAPGQVPEGRRFEGEYRERQVALARQLFNLMGIGRDDKEKREEWVKWGLSLFNAPAAVFISAENSLSESLIYFDSGLLAQTICLAALSFGLGSCIMGQGITFPEVVKRYTGIPESERLIISIALGYPDRDFPANRLESVREPLEKLARFIA